MISQSTLYLIVAGLLLLLIIVIVVIYFLIRNVNNQGTTGTTGSTGNPCSTCIVLNEACSAPNSLKIGYTDTTGSTGATGTTGTTGITVPCNQTCLNTTLNIPVSGCIAPVCNSKFCTPQATLYTNLNSAGVLYNFCGDTYQQSWPNIGCNISLTGQQLANLPMTTSSFNNSIINPIFITTTFLSIYQNTQPTAPDGIPQASIQVNLTDPSVVANPYVLYLGSGILSFQRIKDIIQFGNLANAIWVYNTDNQLLNLFSNFNQSFSLNSLVLSQTSSFGYAGPNAPCGVTQYISPSVVTNNTYNSNTGLFNITQNNNGSYGTLGGSLNVVQDNQGNYLASAIIQSIPNPVSPCPSQNYSRWYSISAINQFLGK